MLAPAGVEHGDAGSVLLDALDLGGDHEFDATILLHAFQRAAMHADAVDHRIRVAEATAKRRAHRDAADQGFVKRIEHHPLVGVGGDGTRRLADAQCVEGGEGIRPDLDARADLGRLLQRTLARTIGFDTSTIAGVIDRLESRGLMQRSASPDDRRVRLLTLTKEGQILLAEVVPSMLLAQDRMPAPLPKRERAEFMRMLRVLVTANNEHSRAPREGG